MDSVCSTRIKSQEFDVLPEELQFSIPTEVLNIPYRNANSNSSGKSRNLDFSSGIIWSIVVRSPIEVENANSDENAREKESERE